jgi:hypothetical protein
MGPLFSGLILVTFATGVLVAVFVALPLSFSTTVAVRAALLFLLGSGFGSALAVVFLALVLGMNVTFTHTGQLIGYLTTIAVFGIATGLILSKSYINKIQAK